MVVGKEAAQTPSRFSVRSSIPDATTYSRKEKIKIKSSTIQVIVDKLFYLDWELEK